MNNQTTTSPTTFAEGDRVLVVAVQDEATHEFKEFAVGREATYIAAAARTNRHVVRFDEEYGDGHVWHVLRVAPPKYTPVEGDRVRVTAVTDGGNTPEWEAFAVGRVVTYDRAEVNAYGGVTYHHVIFDAGPEGQPFDKRFVGGVEPLIDGDEAVADRLRLGDRYTNPERSIALHCHERGPNTYYCSRPKEHGGTQHVAALDHAGEVVEVWPTTQPEPEQASPVSEAVAAGGQEPTGDAEAAAKARYTDLAKATIRMAADQEWCTEFEEVMAGHGFKEVACGRKRLWRLTIDAEYRLSDYDLNTAVANTLSIDPENQDEQRSVPNVLDDVAVIARHEIEWVSPLGGEDPSDLSTQQLDKILQDKGYDSHAYYSPELIDHDDEGDPEGYDPAEGFTPRMPAEHTWTKRVADFEDFIARESRERSWGEYLRDVYQAAGYTRPRPATLHVELEATRKIWPSSAINTNAYARALWDDDVKPGYLTLTKTLSFDIDNPHTDNACHCDERDGEGGKFLPEVMARPVVAGARAQLQDIAGDDAHTWTGNHQDVSISCLWCA